MAGTAMDEARLVEATEYAPLDWDRARMQWEEARALIQMGRFGEARSVLTEAAGKFNISKDKAKRRLESLKLEIAALKSNTQIELKKIEQDSESARLKASTKRRLEAALPRIDEIISSMNSAFDAQEYLRSRMAGQDALRYMQDLHMRLGIDQ